MVVNQTKTVPVEAKEIRIYIKVCDMFTGTLHDQDGVQIGEREDYVPGFFPGEHYGDYLILNIDVDTGRIVNWNVPTAEQLQESFGMNAPEE